MNDATIRCLNILGLEPGASLSQIKEAYRDLVKVWHPDRFTGDPKMQRKAEEKLKIVNAAYAWLSKNYSTTEHSYSQEVPGSKTSEEQRNQQTHDQAPPPRRSSPLRPVAPALDHRRRDTLLAGATVIIALLVGSVLRSSMLPDVPPLPPLRATKNLGLFHDPVAYAQHRPPDGFKLSA